MYVRNMGPHSTPKTVLTCAQAAEAAGIDDLWVVDHVAIAPDQAEGSGGRYLDPLATLAFLAGLTKTIGLGSAVLVLPYRPALPTAKWIATIQELSGGRLRLGVGAGWMETEFRALGVPRERRGAATDATLDLLHRAFASDVVTENGQPFLFLPRPARPPILVGGSGRHALARAVRYGDGWLPMGSDPAKLAPTIAELRDTFAAAGKPAPQVVVITSLPLESPDEAVDRVGALAAVGVTSVIQGWRYADAAEFARSAETLATRVRPRVTS